MVYTHAHTLNRADCRVRPPNDTRHGRHSIARDVPASSRAAELTECWPRWTVAEKGKDGSAVTESVGELFVSVPSPCRDHRKHQPSTLVEELKLERGHFLAHGCDPSEYITRQETQRELVRVLDDSHVPDGQVHGNGNRSHGSHRTRHPVNVHKRILSLSLRKDSCNRGRAARVAELSARHVAQQRRKPKAGPPAAGRPAVPPGELAETMSHLASGVS